MNPSITTTPRCFGVAHWPDVMPTVPCRSGGFAIVLVLLTGLPLAGCGRAPDPVLPTRPLLERTLPLAADATVALDVAPGAFYVARLDPGGMDVELTLTGSDGRMVKVVGPARGAGHAYLSFAPARAGRATLVVRPQAVAPRDARAVLAVYRLPAALSPRARQAFERWTAVTALGADRDPAAATAATETLAAVEDAWRALGAQPLAAPDAGDGGAARHALRRQRAHEGRVALGFGPLQGAEHGVGDGMAEHVRIGVPIQSRRVLDGDPAEHQRPARREAVDVVAEAADGHDSATSETKSALPLVAAMLNLSGLSACGVSSTRPPAARTSRTPAAMSHSPMELSM